MAMGIEFICNVFRIRSYTIFMIEILNMFWSSPIELRVIILAVLIAFPILTYLGMKGTGL